MWVGQDFDVSDPIEQEAYGFDFVNDMAPGDSITQATWTCTVASGTDPTPAARLSGSPWTFGPTATAQFVIGGLAGVTYILNAVVTTTYGQTLSLFAHARVEFIN